MFSDISLRNFKSFGNLEFDLRAKKDEPVRMAMVFGENGAGKTNLIDSVRFLKKTARTFSGRSSTPIQEQRGMVLGQALDIGFPEELREATLEYLGKLVGGTQPATADIVDLAKECMMIGSDDGMSVGYGFYVGGKRAEYRMEFDRDGNLIREMLRACKGERIGTYFDISTGGRDISEKLIADKGLAAEVGKLIDMYWGKHSLLSLLNDQYRAKSAGFMEGAVGMDMGAILEYIDGIMVNIFGEDIPAWPYSLGEGYMPASGQPELRRYEAALDEFFTSACSDVRGVRYRTRGGGPNIHYTLMFDRMIDGEVREVPYGKESSGIRKLCSIFPLLAGSADRRVVFLDEIDSNIHDRMVTELISKMGPYINGQLVFTTHNTGLLKDADPRSAFIILIDPEGRKEIRPISRIGRTQANNNNTVRYLNGAFSGIPYVGYLDMEDIVSRMKGEGEGDGRRHNRGGPREIGGHTLPEPGDADEDQPSDMLLLGR